MKSKGPVCPHCGYDGTKESLGGKKPERTCAGFCLIEKVDRSFDLVRAGKDWIADIDTDDVIWESSGDPVIECGACLHRFPVPEGFSYDFDKV